jgi:hypothetical protein
MYLRKMGLECVDWIHLDQDRDRWRALVNTVIRERIHHTRRELDEISRALLALHLRLAGELSADDWAFFDHITSEKASHDTADDKARQCGKLQKLHGAQHPAHFADNRKAVIILSDVPLVDVVYSALGRA